MKHKITLVYKLSQDWTYLYLDNKVIANNINWSIDIDLLQILCKSLDISFEYIEVSSDWFVEQSADD